jgi:hypothetical protein
MFLQFFKNVKFSSVQTGLLTISLLFVLLLCIFTMYINEDLFLAFAAGRDVAQGVFSGPDHWSFTYPGHIWVNQAWLSHYFLYLSHHHLGPAGPVIVKTFLLFGCAVLVFARCTSLGISINISLFGLALGLFASGPFMGIRPENFGLFFFLLFITFLQQETLPRRIRQWGIPVILIVWSNFHGSFMLGLGLLGIKAAVVTVRKTISAEKPETNEQSWKRVLRFWFIFACALAGIALINPYGLKNLTIPFTQVGSSVVTSLSGDWLSLLGGLDLEYPGFSGLGGYSFIGFIAITLMCMIPVIVRFRVNRQSLDHFGNRTDMVMEAILCLIIVLLAFRFRRLIMFAGLGIVPLAGMMFQVLKSDSEAHASAFQLELTRFLGVLGTASLTILLAVMFYFLSVVPFWPGNPFRQQRPLTRELMSFDDFPVAIPQFLKQNHLEDRVLSGWEVTGFLMAEIPNITQFMDCRDQSYYPPAIMRDYFDILGIGPDPQRDISGLLNAYQVKTVVLASSLFDVELAVKLMNTTTWACIFANSKGLVLVRKDSDIFEAAKRSKWKTIEFPDESTRNVTRAMSSRFLDGKISQEEISGLKKVVLEDPRPNYYALICFGLEPSGECFQEETVRYLESEGRRLHEKLLHSDYSANVLESLIKIQEILEENAEHCRQPAAALAARVFRIQYTREYNDLRKRYLGILFRP